MRHTNISGFTLVELSIAIVIIGLLVAGIAVGRGMIESASIKATLQQVNEYKTAFEAFDQKYRALPGDMANATQYWGALDGNDGVGLDCNNSTVTGKETCNGDGNYKIDDIIEQWHAWVHLVNAGMVNGFYSAFDPDTSTHVRGENLPEVPIGGGFSFVYVDGTPVGFYSGSYDHVLMTFTAEVGATAGDVASVTGEALDTMDRKVDDGRPGTGAYRTHSGVANCVTSSDPDTARYITTAGTKDCSLIVITGL